MEAQHATLSEFLTPKTCPCLRMRMHMHMHMHMHVHVHVHVHMHMHMHVHMHTAFQGSRSITLLPNRTASLPGSRARRRRRK
jgi:hypothetical protein